MLLIELATAIHKAQASSDRKCVGILFFVQIRVKNLSGLACRKIAETTTISLGTFRT